MYELLFSRQKPKAKAIRKHCCNVLFPHVQQQLSGKSHAMKIEDLTSRVQVLEITNEAHRQAIEGKDAAITLLNDDLKDREHYNVALQVQRDVYKEQLEKCQDIIAHLKTRHVPHAKDPGKENIVMTIEKNIPPHPLSRKMSFMSIPTTLRGYNDGSLTQKDHDLKHNTPIIGLQWKN